jgi:Flp pilus assembly protein CpaB
MRRGRILIFLVLIVIVGLVVLALAFNQFGGFGGIDVVPTEAAFKQVYYASQNIPQGTIITQEMLSTFSIPPENVVEVMFEVGEEQNLVGQTARFTLDQGTLITSSMIGSAPAELSGPAWAVQIPAGMVAVTIPTNRLSVAGYGINDGAHVNVNACMLFVDVDPAFQTVLPNFTSVITGTGFLPDALPVLSVNIVTGENPSRQGRVELDPTLQQPLYAIPSEGQRPRLVCQMILQDVVVMNLGNFDIQTPVAVDPNAPPVQTQEPKPDIITLMVSPQDSIALNYFVYSGAVISMTLRNPNDNSRIDAQSATLTSLLTQYNISLPSKLPYAQQPRVDILISPPLPNDVVDGQPEQ